MYFHDVTEFNDIIILKKIFPLNYKQQATYFNPKEGKITLILPFFTTFISLFKKKVY